MNPSTSLIIITLDRAGLLRATLAGLVRQRRSFSEVLVIDNGPDAATEAAVCAFAGELPVRYIPEGRRGYGPARNRGLREAQGDVLYFLDDDCVAEPGWSETLWNVLASGEADLVCGSRMQGYRGLAARLEYLSTDGPVLSPTLVRAPARHLSTSNLILRREVVEKAGLFDETLAMCEDRDFTARARRLGFRLLFEPRARVTHYSRTGNIAGYLGRMRHYGFGTSQYFRRRAEDEPLAALFPAHPLARLLLLPVLAAAGTAYLVRRNLPHCPDAVLSSPLLFIGQLWWHWGGFQAMRAERAKAVK